MTQSDVPMPSLDKTEPPHHFYEKTLSSELIFKGKVATVRVDKVLHPSGAVVEREVVEHPGGVVVCPILDDGRIIFVEQWRYPLQRTLLELPAGKLDWTDGVPENPFDAIRRELWEETGYEADEWQEITTIYTAPGFCNEKLWLYKATHLRDARHKQNGDSTQQPSEHEWLDVVLLTPEEAIEKIRRREIADSKTVALLCLVFAENLSV
jgi:ADP-ribose pyrophosphatase